MELPFEQEPYPDANSSWPQNGQHILATYTEKSIIVYQAYKPSIAKWVVEHQTFLGCPGYSVERMTWIKPNFLWMMYRSNWATKPNQESILAMTVTIDGFNQLLKLCKRKDKDMNFLELTKDKQGAEGGGLDIGMNDVRIQWDPDHDPFGEKVERRAIQLGIRGQTLSKFLKEWVISIADITEFVKSQHCHVLKNDLQLLSVPTQRIYEVGDLDLRNHVGVD